MMRKSAWSKWLAENRFSTKYTRNHTVRRRPVVRSVTGLGFRLCLLYRHQLARVCRERLCEKSCILAKTVAGLRDS